MKFLLKSRIERLCMKLLCHVSILLKYIMEMVNTEKSIYLKGLKLLRQSTVAAPIGFISEAVYSNRLVDWLID